jgi:hypothetical protein
MSEPTLKQYKILKEITENGQQGFNNSDLTDDHWELVRMGYARNLVSLGIYSWIFEATDKGREFIDSQE